MLTEKMVKAQLEVIAAADFQVPAGEDPFQLARTMTAYVGAIDPVLRDDLIYTTFANWIWHQNCFSHDQLKALLTIFMDEAHLTHHLGEQNTDTIFMRSFSALHIALILAAGPREGGFTRDDLHEVKHNLLRYLHIEKDLRGYVPAKGWAHAVAHTADALDELVQFSEVDKTDLQEILGFIRTKVAAQQVVYHFDEDERLTVAVVNAWARGLLAETEIIAWIDSFAELLTTTGTVDDRYRQYVNVKHFLRALYFRAIAADAAVAIIDGIAGTLAKIQRF